MFPVMDLRAERVETFTAPFVGEDLNPHYLGFIHCFNQRLYYEAHEVLEVLWLTERGRADGRFYQGLIQLAGAFVHWEKGRPGPAAALLRLAGSNLQGYPRLHHRLDLNDLRLRLEEWSRELPLPHESWQRPLLTLVLPEA
jgi:predicted metal-dependent hydrolase